MLGKSWHSPKNIGRTSTAEGSQSLPMLGTNIQYSTYSSAKNKGMINHGNCQGTPILTNSQFVKRKNHLHTSAYHLVCSDLTQFTNQSWSVQVSTVSEQAVHVVPWSIQCHVKERGMAMTSGVLYCNNVTIRFTRAPCLDVPGWTWTQPGRNLRTT